MFWGGSFTFLLDDFCWRDAEFFDFKMLFEISVETLLSPEDDFVLVVTSPEVRSNVFATVEVEADVPPVVTESNVTGKVLTTAHLFAGGRSGSLVAVLSFLLCRLCCFKVHKRLRWEDANSNAKLESILLIPTHSLHSSSWLWEPSNWQTFDFVALLFVCCIKEVVCLLWCSWMFSLMLFVTVSSFSWHSVMSFDVLKVFLSFSKMWDLSASLWVSKFISCLLLINIFRIIVN